MLPSLGLLRPHSIYYGFEIISAIQAPLERTPVKRNRKHFNQSLHADHSTPAPGFLDRIYANHQAIVIRPSYVMKLVLVEFHVNTFRIVVEISGLEFKITPLLFIQLLVYSYI